MESDMKKKEDFKRNSLINLFENGKKEDIYT